MFMRGGMGYSAQGTGITSGMDTPRPRYYGGGTIGGGTIMGNMMGNRTGFEKPMSYEDQQKELTVEEEKIVKTPRGTNMYDVISSFGTYANMKNPDGSYKTGPEGNFLMKKGSKFASEEQKNKYLTALQESQKEIQDQYDQAYNTGKGWGELAESLEEKGYEDLAIFANKGSVERNTESVRQEQQYVNIRSYASELLGNGATKEDVDKLSQKTSLYKNNIIKSNNILDLTTQDNVQDKVLVAKWNRKSKDWEKDNERFTSKSTLVPRKYNDDGSPRAITSDDAMNGALELLMQNGNILFSQDAYKTIAGAFKVDPSKIQILGSGTPSETSTKIEFMVDGKEYALERGGLKFTYDKTTPKKISGSREGFYWTQQINLFEKPKKGEEGKAKQHVWDLVTRGEDWRAEIDGKSINELISNNQQRDSRIVSKKMAAVEQISKKLYQEKADEETFNFYKDSTFVGSVGVDNSDNITISGNSSHAGFEFGSSSIVAYKNGTSPDNTISLGGGAQRFADLYLGGGIYVGGTGSANKLDDYEEGTWTPTYGSGLTSVTYSAQQGQYTKVGRMVSFAFRLENTAGTANGNILEIHGLPFTTNSSQPGSGAHWSYQPAGITGDQTFSPILFVPLNQNKVRFYNAAGGSFVGSDLVSTTNDIYIRGVYFTN